MRRGHGGVTRSEKIFLSSLSSYRKINLSHPRQPGHRAFQTSVSLWNSHDDGACQIWDVSLDPTRGGLLCKDSDT